MTITFAEIFSYVRAIGGLSLPVPAGCQVCKWQSTEDICQGTNTDKSY